MIPKRILMTSAPRFRTRAAKGRAVHNVLKTQQAGGTLGFFRVMAACQKNR
jgi:hypothetical protein